METTRRKTSLRTAVRQIAAGKMPGVYRCGLAGCPVGGWAETTQAIRRIDDELPSRSTRSYTVHQLIDALYAVDGAGRYCVRSEVRS